MILILIKIIISILVVLALAEIARRVSPVLGGVLNGMPLGAGLSVYFISYEKGISYMLKGIPWGIAGLCGSILFCLIYLSVGRLLRSKNKMLSIMAASFVGAIVFAASGYLLKTLALNLISALAIFIIAFISNLIIMNKLQITHQLPSNRSSTWYNLLMRGLLVGIIICVLTGIAVMAGSQWAGILSAFPSTLYALILVLHIEERDRLYPAVLYGFSYGISTLVVFYISCWFLLEKLGLNWGFVVLYLISGIYLLGFNQVRKMMDVSR